MEQSATDKANLPAMRLLACKLLLAALLAFPPSIGLAFRLAYAETGGETAYPVDSASAERVAATGAAVAPQMLVAAEIADWRDVLDPNGASALELWLAGEELTDDQLFSIDAEALRQIDADLAERIRLEQEQRVEKQPSGGSEGPASGVDGHPSATGVVNSDPEVSGSSGVVNSSAGSDEGAVQGVTGKVEAGNERSDSSSDAESAEGIPADSEWTYAGDTTYTPRNLGVSLTTTKFIAVIGEPARKLAAENDLYASVMIAQAILESASGNSGLAQAPNFNLFGIKGSYRGSSVTMSTQEDDGTGSYYTIDAAFRKYPSYRESLSDYVDLLSRAYYAPAHKSNTKSFVEACDYLQGTYATSTSYSASLQDLIATYDLTRYDEPLGYELSQEITVQVEDEAASLLAGSSVVVAEKRDLVDLVAVSTGHLGCPYEWGATGPDEFDCSGLVWSTYREALGISLPRVAADQAQVGTDVDFADLHMGDLLFFTDDEGHVNHAAMYLAEGCYIESTSPGGVQVTAMEEHMPALAKRVVCTSETRLTTAFQGSTAVDRWATDEEELQLYMMYLGI